MRELPMCYPRRGPQKTSKSVSVGTLQSPHLRAGSPGFPIGNADIEIPLVLALGHRAHCACHGLRRRPGRLGGKGAESAGAALKAAAEMASADERDSNDGHEDH